MKLTILILLLPVVTFLGMIFGAPIVQMASLFGYLLSSLVCLGWGFYISGRSRILGWLCVALGVAPLILMLLPAFSET